MDSPVRSSTKKVIQQLKFIDINKDEIPNFADELLKVTPDFSALEYINKLKSNDISSLLTFSILMHSNGFCFWNVNYERWHYQFKDGTRDSGQFAFIQAWVDYFNQDPKRFNFEYFSTISFQQFLEIYQGGKNLYLLEERWESLKDTSKILLNEYNGEVQKLLTSADQQLSKLLPLITDKFVAFRDQINYKNEVIYFWKLSQLFVYDIISSFKSEDFSKFKDLDYLTGLADYKIPQLFEEFNLTKYNQELESKVINKVLIEPDSTEHVEIRATAIYLIDLLHREYRSKGGRLPLHQFNDLLFLKAKSTDFKKPYHLCKNRYY